jgi:hypothetical protein
MAAKKKARAAATSAAVGKTIYLTSQGHKGQLFEIKDIQVSDVKELIEWANTPPRGVNNPNGIFPEGSEHRFSIPADAEFMVNGEVATLETAVPEGAQIVVFGKTDGGKQ